MPRVCEHLRRAADALPGTSPDFCCADFDGSFMRKTPVTTNPKSIAIVAKDTRGKSVRQAGQQLSCAASCPPSTFRPQQQGRVVAAEMCPPFQQQHFSSEREMRDVSGPSSSPKSIPRVWPTQRSISQPPPSQHHMPWLQDTPRCVCAARHVPSVDFLTLP